MLTYASPRILSAEETYDIKFHRKPHNHLAALKSVSGWWREAVIVEDAKRRRDAFVEWRQQESKEWLEKLQSIPAKPRKVSIFDWS